MALAYDTLGLSEELAASGMPEKQAKAVASAIRDKVMPNLASKADIEEVKGLIERESLRVRLWLGATVIGATVTSVGILSAVIKLI